VDWQARVEKWADERNLIQGSAASLQLAKLLEEVGELATAVAIGDISGALDGIGDACVVLTIMAKQLGSGLDECQELAWEEIKDRKGFLLDGVFIKEA
jgi:NTP pyrophosphatase (non-canonical NTP hydrolase)